MLDPTLDEAGLVVTGLEELLADYGARVGSDLVVDPANALPFFGAETIFVDSYGDHVITRPLIVPLGRSVTREEAPGLEIVELLRTGSDGWGETDLVNLDRVEAGDADLAGPVPLGVAVEMTGDDEGETAEEAPAVIEEAIAESAADEDSPPEPAARVPAESQSTLRLVVLGDSGLASNGQLQNAPNATFVANAMNWLVERETLVSIPSKKPEQVRLNLTRGQLRGVTWTVLALLPGLALAAGVAVYRQRRR